MSVEPPVTAGEEAETSRSDGAEVGPQEEEPVACRQMFEADGYCVLRQLVDPALLERGCEEVVAQFLAFREAADGAAPEGRMGVGLKHGYKEFTQRMPGRFEMVVSRDGALGDIRDAVEKTRAWELALEVLRGEDEDEPRLLGMTCVVAEGGCGEQAWHADGGHTSTTTHLPCHVLNIFFPLVDCLGNGTEVRPGGHYLTRDLTRQMLLAKCKKTLRQPVSPSLRKGDCLMFDWRCLHRGLANGGESLRPVLVFSLAKPWFKDGCNWPKRSIRSIGAGDDGSEQSEEIEAAAKAETAAALEELRAGKITMVEYRMRTAGAS